VVVGVLAVLGLAAGTLLPSVIGTLPDRDPEPGELARTPYRVLATTPRLRPVLSGVTAVTWAVLAAARGWVPDLPAYLLVGAVGVALAYIDLREHRLPDVLTAVAFAGGAVFLGLTAAATGDWIGYGRAWLLAGVMFVAFLGLAMLRPADLGLGDVKLAGVIGLMLGWLGWGEAVLGAFLGFLFGGLTGVFLLLAGRAGRRTAIPFGPFMLLGALVAVAAGGAVLDAYLGR
jgi:leader peptidase (prepilin peptidase) / N-methyltransferase